MTFLQRSVLLFMIAAASAQSAEGGPTITPVPGPTAGDSMASAREGRPPLPFGRPQPAFEVEVLTVKPDDQASLAAWALLAAQGYHVVAAVNGSAGAVFYLERSAGMMGQVAFQLPAVIDHDKSVADA